MPGRFVAVAVALANAGCAGLWGFDDLVAGDAGLDAPASGSDLARAWHVVSAAAKLVEPHDRSRLRLKSWQAAHETQPARRERHQLAGTWRASRADSSMVAR